MMLGIGLPGGDAELLEDQVARMRELWENARTSDRDHGVTVVFPQIPRLDQVEQLAEHVLPTYL